MPSESTEALSKGFDTSTKNLILFVPALAPAIIHVLFLILAYVVFPYRYSLLFFDDVVVPNAALIWGGYFLSAILGFFASCMIVDMVNDKINNQPIDLNKSMNSIMSRLGTLILAGIIAAVCYVTFILIPVALFIIAIAIIEKKDAIESTKKSIDFVIKNLGEVIVFLIIVVVIWVVLGIGFALIPVVGAYLGSVISWFLNVVLTVAAVYFYLSLRQPSPPTSSPDESK